ncbi:MAG: lipoprotein signal peptidase [Flavobacteriales bacterium]|nr:lipoprotein signal peptidase [Flavobacteriales bacterium]PIV93930.1 MAG: lipoprotein signal peptidase [Flavobacteriaceae bacterium CG17_big_fil_post_rev_8_21_14_2_50_33_15]PIY13530.1 MAG: lipoprotein signal peptidase [Flavobacteriaceae bacterium CG_4_10_14_3_um_filter_33_47]PJB18958.1 MAG: lipoprotein signal peptidase [Flavobacteriaceae bacterium CG_4_9_14_3_um_filter_33_16]NCQ13738.1 lipoprotein signal peptidase [Flavobacteriales bacterium]
MSLKKSVFLITLILLIDQISKIYIKTHFALGDEYQVFNWFKIYFVENDGMAWGTKISDFISFISDRTAKIALTVFRIVAIVGIGYWLLDATKKNSPRILLLAIAFIFSGALGNIVDSVFYGMLFNDSHGQIATFLPKEGGYDGLLHGRVVDMLYFPLWKGYLPEWIPFFGGQFFTFFEPVFNVADMAISTGFVMLLVFNKKAFPKNTLQS